MEKFLGFLVVMVLGILASIYNGFVFTYLWLWFIVPFGIRELTVPHAMGLLIVPSFTVMGLYIAAGYVQKTDEVSNWSDTFRGSVTSLTLFLVANYIFLYGYIVHSFM